MGNYFIYLSVVLSIIIFVPLYRVLAGPTICDRILGAGAIATKTMVLILVIGLVFTIIFLGIRLAGSIVGYQIGFAMVNVMDPNSPNPVSILGEFWMISPSSRSCSAVRSGASSICLR